MWWLHATTPGRMPSVTQAFATKWPISVSTRTRSPVRPTPSRAASVGWIQSGLVCASSSSHLALAERVWIWVGSRNVESSTTWSAASRAGWTWLRM